MSKEKEKEKKNLFHRLTRLFKSGPVVKRKIKGLDTAIAVTDRTKSSGALLFQRSVSPTYSTITANSYNLSERLMRYQDFCFTGDTLVATCDEQGYSRLDDLVSRWNAGDTDIWTFSYDKETNCIVSSKVTGAKCNGIRKILTVTLDDGSSIRCTPDHRFMLKDSSYVEAQNLTPGTALMRFSRADFGTPYRYVQTKNRGWKPEHVLVAEAAANRLCAEGEHVHHKNFKHRDNLPHNLEIMSEHDHMSLHAKINNLRFSDPAQRERMSEVMKSRWLENGDLRVNLPQVIEKTRELSRARRVEFNKASRPGRFNIGRKDQYALDNANADKNFTYQDICNSFDKSDTLRELSKKLGVSEYKIKKRLSWEGYKNFKDFSSAYENHKVVSVVDHGEEELVYDIEVKGYSNFALAKKDESLGAQGVVIVHNCEMEYTPEIAAALDIYADETCAQDEKGRVLHIYSDNEKIKEILEDLFYNTLNVEFNLRSWARNLVKYGDFFLYNDVSPTQGVINAFPIPVNEIEREENYDREDPFAVRYRWTTMGNRTLENWEVTHFRYIGNDMFLPYGSSVIEAARRIWRQLILLEDAMLVYRVVRAPERRVFYLDVANIPPESVPTYVEEQRKNLRTNQVIDRNTGRVDLRYSPLSVEDDYFIPVRGGESGTRIDTLAGGQNTASVEDVAYIQKKLFAALKIPRAYLGYDEMLSSKATLAQEDIRFSRTINVIQKTLISELNKLAIVHLYSHGFDNEDLQNFVLRLSNPSTVAQQQKLELWRSKFEIGGALPEGMGSKQFIQKEIWGLNDEQIAAINEQRKQEKLIDSEIESASSESSGGEAAGGTESGEETEPAPGEEAGGEEAGGGEEGGLFANDTPSDDAEPGAKLLLSIDDEPLDMPNLYEKDKLPIKKSNKAKYSAKKAQDDSLRRKKWNLHEPDFLKMSSLHQSMNDPFDKSWLDKQFKDPLGINESKTSKMSTSLPPDVVSSLKKMSSALGIRRSTGQDGLLMEQTEEIDVDIEK